MVESNALLPIVMGIGLAVLSGGTLASSRMRGGDSGWRDPLFVLAVLLIGLAVFGAALYEIGWSIETGHRLPAAEARAENWLILTLALLLVAVAVRSAWVAFFYSSDSPPWERGHLDRLPPLIGFVMASLGVLLIGLIVDAIVLLVARFEPGASILIVAATLAVGVTSAWVALRHMSGGNPSPRALMMSRQAQLKLLAALDGASGEWLTVEIYPRGEVDCELSLSVTIWTAERGMYWRSDDAFALARYHNWVANHLLAPTPAVHRQRLTLANPTKRMARHMVIKPWTERRARWLDTLRMNRAAVDSCTDATSPEHAAGLVHVPYQQLSAAGLQLRIRGASTAKQQHSQPTPYDSAAVSSVRASSAAHTDRAC
jgi:hypothetical protein